MSSGAASLTIDVTGSDTAVQGLNEDESYSLIVSPQGIQLTSDGGNKVKATISIGPLSDTAEAQVTQTGPNTINVKVIDAGEIPSDLLGNLANFSFSIPKLPAGVSIQSVSVTQQGVMVTISGTHTTLSQNS